MERICEARVRDGFPGLAIQWTQWGMVAEKLEKLKDAVIGQLCTQDRDIYVEETLNAETLGLRMDQ
jgi:hypothetical protein